MKRLILPLVFKHASRAAICIFSLMCILGARAEQGLVGYYAFDETSGTIAIDQSASAKNGTLNGGISRVTGVLNGALNFDGSTGYVDIPNSPDLSGGSMTAAAWIYRQAGVEKKFISKWNDNTSSYQFDFQVYQDSKLWLELRNSSDVTSLARGSTTIDVNKWYHVAAVADASTNQITLYVNGVAETLQQPVTWDGTIRSLNMDMNIGRKVTGVDNWTGSIDEVRIYNRALSATEILALAVAPPTAVADIFGTQINTPLSVSAPGVLGNDIDPGTVGLTSVLDSNVSNGTLALNSNGSFTYTPTTGFTGTDSFTYHVVNSKNQASSPASVLLPIVPQGLIAYYTFDEGTGTVANDYSGNGNTGILENGPVWTTGIHGGGLSFDGVNDEVKIPDNLIHNNTTLSIALWFRSTTSGVMVGMENSNESNVAPNLYIGSDGKLRGAFYAGTTVPPVSTNPVTDGNWHHALLIGAVNTQSLYLDGKLVGSLSGTINNLQMTSNQLGYANAQSSGWTGAGSSYFNGVLDDVRFYNRVLSTSEIQALATPSAGSSPSTIMAVNAVASYGGSQSVMLNATVTAGASVNEGSVEFQILNGTTPVGSPAFSSTVSNGNASASFLLPAGTPAGSYMVSASYIGGATYAPSIDTAHTLTISKVALTVNTNNFSRVYGSANPTFTGNIVGIQDSDNITATYATSATTTSAVAGYSIVPTLIDPGGKLANYSVTSNNGTLTVTAAPLSVTPANFSRAYGAANPTLSGTITGVKNADNITATYTTGATVLSTVGPYAIVPMLVDPNNKLGNYAVTPNNGTLTVTQATLTAVAFNATRMYGAANPVFSGILSGVLNGDNILTAYNTTATPTSAVGNYAITPSLFDPNGKAGNYLVNLSNGTLAVTQAPLSVAAANTSRPYGSANPVFSGTLTGVQNNDDITATYSTNAVPASLVGSYSIVPALVDPNSLLGNYTVTSNNGTLTVDQAMLTVTPANASVTYNNPLPVLSGTVSGIQNNDNITASYSTTAVAGGMAGPYPITATLSDPGNVLPNYAVTLNTGTLTIQQATPAIAWSQPAAIFAGVPLDDTQLNAAASDPITTAALSGTYVYTPASGTVLAPGLGQSLSVTFTPDDSVDYTPATASVTIDVNDAIPVSITSVATASGQIGTSFTYTITVTGSAPMTFGASGLPPGLSFNVDTISGMPTATGVFDVVLTGSNYANTVTQPLKIVVTSTTGVNHAPVFTSPPKASPDPATTGVPVTLTASATDADGDVLDYTWDFGDGTTGLGASISKTYSVAGVYIVNVVVSDGQASDMQSINLVVEDVPPSGMFAVQKVSVEFSFGKSGSDSLTVSGTIPVPTGFSPLGKSVQVLIGGLDKTYTLTSKGASADKTFSLKGKPGSNGTFAYELKKQDLFALFESLGFSKTQNNPSLVFPVVVVLNGTSYLDQPVIKYTVKGNKKGPLSGLGKK